MLQQSYLKNIYQNILQSTLYREIVLFLSAGTDFEISENVWNAHKGW